MSLDAERRLTDDEALSILAAARAWPALMFTGVVTVALGVTVLVWPSETLVVLSVLFGIQLLLLGLFRLVGAFSEVAISPTLAGISGILLMVGGVVILRNPFGAVEVLATILGVVWIVSGAVEAIDAVANVERSHRLWHALGGLLSLVAGIVVVAWPAPTIAVVAWVGGLQMAVFGAVIVATALAVRRAVRAA